MSEETAIPKAAPSKRLTIGEFVKKRMQLLDDNHTQFIVKKIAAEKDLEHIKDQLAMHEGAVLYLNRMLKEWATYENDTMRLRGVEAKQAEKRLKDQVELQNTLKKKEKLKRKRKLSLKNKRETRK